jgi:two-component system, NtrC family, sensor kinase
MQRASSRPFVESPETRMKPDAAHLWSMLKFATQRCSMQFMKLLPRSLHAKILLGYIVVGGLFVMLVFAALEQVRNLLSRVDDEHHVTRMHDVVREARRLEKNYLLFRKPSELKSAVGKTDEALSLIERDRSLMQRAAPGFPLEELEQSLSDWRDLLDDRLQRRIRPGDPISPLEERMTDVGKQAFEQSERLSDQAREAMRRALSGQESQLYTIMIAAIVLVLGIGQLVTRRVVAPLREVESDLARVGTGNLARLTPRDRDDEIAALVGAFNRALGDLEERQLAVLRTARLASLGTMLSGVAHELNNPLSNISLNAQLLLEEHERPDPTQLNAFVEQIDDQVQRAQRIVRTLLDFARDSHFALLAQPLRPLVEETIALLRAEQPGAGDAVSVRIAPELNIHADGQRMQQALLNLIRNALEACAETKTPPKIEVSASVKDNATVIKVCDNGPGIDPGNMPRVFDPFFTTKPVGKGSGLGLFVVHEIAAEHGGKVSIDNGPDGGTCVSLWIPAEEEA